MVKTITNGVLEGAAAGLSVGFLVGMLVSCAGFLVGASAGTTVGAAVFLLCIPTGALIGGLTSLNREANRQKAGAEAEAQRRKAEAEAQARRQRAIEAERQKAQEEWRKAEEERLKAYLVNTLSGSRNLFLGLPALVATAEANLDRAEAEFAEGVFARFWDEIEHATARLAEYHKNVKRIKKFALEYQRRAAALPFPVRPFALPAGKPPDARATATRFASVVRKAQKNFQFATIYEQRKTNKILVAGFSTLASAIHSLHDLIDSSLSDLCSTLHVSLDHILATETAEAADRRQFEQKSLERQDEQSRMLDDIRRLEDRSLEWQDEQSKMLDDIRRRRKPLL